MSLRKVVPVARSPKSGCLLVSYDPLANYRNPLSARVLATNAVHCWSQAGIT